MVNKIAVIAIVLIVAAPILIGYGMAFEEVNKSSWDPDGSPTLITDALLNDTSYNYTTLDTYSENSSVYIPGYFNTGLGITPKYESTSVYQTILATQGIYNEVRTRTATANTTYDIYDTSQSAYIWELTSATFNITTTVDVTFTYADATTSTITGVTDLYSAGSTFIGYVGGSSFSVSDVASFSVSSNTTFIANQRVTITGNGGSGLYQGNTPNVAYGWTFSEDALWGVPGNATSFAALTIDFSDLEGTYQYTVTPTDGSDPQTVTIVRHNTTSPSDPSYMTVNGEHIYLNMEDDGTISEDMNVYQILFNMTSFTVNYIGKMPTIGTQAYAYSSVVVPYDVGVNSEIESISLPDGPVYRMDISTIRSNTYPIIHDKVYQFGTFSGYPSSSVVLSKPEIVGDSLTIAGETFTTSGNYLTISGKKVLIDKLEIRSYLEDGVYHNTIGKYALPDTNIPLTITFNGIWYLGVNETPLKYNTWVSTEWQPGVFAWNGVDSSFALMGLITCVGVFIGLGMYGRRSGAKVGTLMLICGGAALIFLALI